MKLDKLSVFYAAILLAGCNSESESTLPSAPVATPAPVPAPTPTPAPVPAPTPVPPTLHQSVTLKQSDINIVSEQVLSFVAPGITSSNTTEIKGLSSNFGAVSVDEKTGQFHFMFSSENTTFSKGEMSPELAASKYNHQFKIEYKIGNTQYDVSGHALPLYTKEEGDIAVRFSKIDAEGQVLNDSSQVLPIKEQGWSCVVDNETTLTWQTLQASGDYAFDSTYYWGDRTINHRDHSKAVCSLGADCNTDNLISSANTAKLCGISDWRLPTKKEWQSLLDLKMLSDDQRLSPIDSFYFPYFDANYDEAYWTGTFTQYPDGHDKPSKEGDWQGSNSTVGDAYVAWMASDFANNQNPPRSTNEPWFSILVHGPMMADDTGESGETVKSDDSVELAREVIKTGDENDHWQKRFVKLGGVGEVLQNQAAATWACTNELFYLPVLKSTRVLWQRVDKASMLMSYSQAEQYVNQVNVQSLCGRKDWRLPTENELKSLLVDDYYFETEGFSYRAGYVDSVLDDTVVGDNSFYWTSTKSEYFPESQRMAVAFQSEWSDSSSEGIEQLYRVRLISTSIITL